MEISLVGKGVEFHLSLTNGTASKVANVCYPLIGGLSGVGKEAAIVAPTLQLTTRKLTIPFPGCDFPYPTSISGSLPLTMAFVDIHDPATNRGFYFGTH